MFAFGRRLWNIFLGFYVVKTDFSTISCITLGQWHAAVAKIACGWSIPKLAILWVKINELRKQHLQNSLNFHFLEWKTQSRVGSYVASWLKIVKFSFFITDCNFFVVLGFSIKLIKSMVYHYKSSTSFP